MLVLGMQTQAEINKILSIYQELFTDYWQLNQLEGAVYGSL